MSAYIDGPFVYRLGRKIFILERAVRFCYGLPKALNSYGFNAFFVMSIPDGCVIGLIQMSQIFCVMVLR